MSLHRVPASEDGNFSLLRAIRRFKGDGASPQSAKETGAEAIVNSERSATVQSVARNNRWPLPGLAPMTRIRTSFGDVHAIALRKGDEVLLRSGQYAKIQWLNRIKLDEAYLKIKPDANPVRVAMGALGRGLPTSDIMLSPRQVICADGSNVIEHSRDAFTLISRPGVRQIAETGLAYTMFHVGAPADVYCEGIYLHFPMDGD